MSIEKGSCRKVLSLLLGLVAQVARVAWVGVFILSDFRVLGTLLGT